MFEIVLEHIQADRGIYMIECSKNGKVYIGRSVNIRCRVLTHLNKLRSNTHSNKIMQHSFNKYGEDSFTFKTLEVLEINSDLNKREAYWGRKYRAIENGFNICPFTSREDIGDKHGELVLGEKNGKAKLSSEKIVNICKLINEGISGVKIGEKYGIRPETALNVKNGRTWGDISHKYLKEEIVEKWSKERKEKWCA